MRISDLVIRITLFLYAMVVVLPLIWVVYTSLKTNKELFQSPWALPEKLQWVNYLNAWDTASIGKYFFNSIIVTLGMLIVTLILSSMAAYILSRFTFKGNSIIYSLFIAGLLVPNILGTIPVFKLLRSMSLLDTHTGLILVYSAYGMSFTILLLYGFFKTLPRELEEASIMDGASNFKVFFNVMLPLAKPGLITASIFNFLWYWNEYPLALTIITSDAKKTLPLGIVHLTELTTYRTEWTTLFAGIVILMLPIMIMYIFLQKELVGGLNTGSVKE